MKNAKKLRIVAVVAFLGTGLLLAGCKSTTDLTQAGAQQLIQAKYDQTPPVGVTITVDDLGLKQGLTAKYWKLVKVYPNNRWADYALTDDGKKAVTLVAGGDTIQWRPEPDAPAHFVIVTVAANHLKAHNIKEILDEMVPGVDGLAKVANYTESVNMDGVPQPLQDMAHNPGNKLASKHTANFAPDGSGWKLFSIN